MLPLEIAVYTLVALASTAVATPTPTRGLKQATRADVVRRIKRGVRPRAPVPSGAGGAPETVRTSSTQSGGLNYARYFTGSGAILSASPYGEDPDFPSKYTTYANTVSTVSAAQQCVDFAYGNDRIGVALWFDESDDLWHCRATFNPNRASDFTAADANARPVYGYNYAAA